MPNYDQIGTYLVEGMGDVQSRLPMAINRFNLREVDGYPVVRDVAIFARTDEILNADLQAEDVYQAVTSIAELDYTARRDVLNAVGFAVPFQYRDRGAYFYARDVYEAAVVKKLYSWRATLKGGLDDGNDYVLNFSAQRFRFARNDVVNMASSPQPTSNLGTNTGNTLLNNTPLVLEYLDGEVFKPLTPLRHDFGRKTFWFRITSDTGEYDGFRYVDDTTEIVPAENRYMQIRAAYDQFLEQPNLLVEYGQDIDDNPIQWTVQTTERTLDRTELVLNLVSVKAA